MASTLHCDKCHKSQKNEEEEWGRASMWGCGMEKASSRLDLCKECSEVFLGVVGDFLRDKK